MNKPAITRRYGSGVPVDGVIWWSTRAATVGLVVAGGVVVDCPPYARRWAYDKPARELWDRAKRTPGTQVRWIPEPGLPV